MGGRGRPFESVDPQARFWAKVDKSGPTNLALGTSCWLWTAGLTAKGYAKFRGPNSRLGHRYSWELKNGRTPRLLDHHYLCPKHCVNPDHLREATHKQNSENWAGPQSNNSSGIRGVKWRKGRWEAYARHHGRYIYFGRFLSLEEAEAAVIKGRNAVHTHNDRDRT